MSKLSSKRIKLSKNNDTTYSELDGQPFNDKYNTPINTTINNNTFNSNSTTTTTISSPLSKELVNQINKISTTYSTTLPYPHCVLSNITDPPFCRSVIKELKENLTATYKESDLFKFYQTLDLGNLEVGSEKATLIPNVMKLREVRAGAKRQQQQ